MRPLGITNGRIGQLLTVICERLQLGSPSTLVVASGAVTITKSWHKITSPTTGTTNLTTINGGQPGDILVLQAADAAKTISVRDNAGNLQLASNFAMSDTFDTIVLLFDSPNWVELCRSNN